MKPKKEILDTVDWGRIPPSTIISYQIKLNPGVINNFIRGKNVEELTGWKMCKYLHIDFYETFPEMSKRKPMLGYRLEKDLSLRDLSKLCGVNFNSIGRIERGVSLPNVEIAYKIASTLGITIEEYFDLKKENINEKDESRKTLEKKEDLES